MHNLKTFFLIPVCCMLYFYAVFGVQIVTQAYFTCLLPRLVFFFARDLNLFPDFKPLPVFKFVFVTKCVPVTAKQHGNMEIYQ